MIPPAPKPRTPATTTREIRLAGRPRGWPTADDFELVEVDLREPAAGEVLVRNEYLSVDPYMRLRMNDVPSYVPPYELGKVMEGGAVGVVVASTVPELASGDRVLHNLGWREHSLGPAPSFRRVSEDSAPPQAHLYALGMAGLAAYVGVVEIAAVQPGETVFVSGAAGAVGSLAGQIARIRGAARVVGSAGSAQKVAYLLDELGFDAAFDYHDGLVRDLLEAAAPEGIHAYFDNVGGDHLEAALWNLRNGGRIAACGAIATYNAAAPAPGPSNLFQVVARRATMRGFLVGDHRGRLPEFSRQMAGWLDDGRVRVRETISDGLEHMPEALLRMFRGDNVGKMLVRVDGQPPT